MFRTCAVSCCLAAVLLAAACDRGPPGRTPAGTPKEAGVPELWSYLRWAAEKSAYGEDAVEAAGLLGGERAQAVLDHALLRFEDDSEYEDEDLAMVALTAMARRGDEDAVARIAACVEESGEDWVGEQAARALAHVPGPESLELLVRLATADDYDIRTAAACALARRGEPEALDALKGLLDDDDEDVAATAAGILAARGDPDGKAMAESLLGEEDEDLDSWFATGVGAVGDASALPCLEPIAKRDMPDSRAAVARALGEMDDPALAERLRAMLADGSRDVRLAAATSLALGYGNAEGAEVLVEAAKSEPDLDARALALRALGRLARPEDREVLLGVFRADRDDEVHRYLKIWAAYGLLRLSE